MDSHSPQSNLLNLGLLGPNPAFGSGSQQGNGHGSGSNHADSPSIESILAGGSSMGGLTPVSGNMHGYQDPFNPAMLPNLQTQMMDGQHRMGHMSAMPGESPLSAQAQHRLSTGSNGQYVPTSRHGSMARSDTTSPNPAHNPPTDGSTHTITSQPPNSDKGNDAQQVAPPWSELKTKAGKDRKRLPLACIACRRKKIRCSGEKPACKHCLRSRIPCVYKVTTRKAAPRTDYMAMLDKRLKRMEDRVIKILPKEEQSVVVSTGRAVVKPPLPPAPEKGKGGASSKKRGAEQAFGEELDEWAGSKGTSSAASQNGGTSRSDENVTVDGEDRGLLLEGKDKLPSSELQEHLSETFFDFVYCQSYPLLHKPSFMRKLAQGTVPPVLMLAVCAISARFSTHPSLKTEPAFLRGETWASAAREISLRRYDTPNITILIVYLILGLHEFGTCQGGRSWMFGGMAQRMAYALQLHRDLDHEPKSKKAKLDSNADPKKSDLTFTDREIRRRTMWSCFLMDRFNSSGTERPIFVSEQYIEAQLPLKEKFFQMEITGPTEDLDGKVPNPADPDSGQTGDPRDNMGVLAYLIRLVSVWGKLIHYMNLGGKERDKYAMWEEQSIFQSIQREVDKWDESLPTTLQYTQENLENHAGAKIANQYLFMHIVRNQVKLFMNRFALPMPSMQGGLSRLKQMPREFVMNASQAARDAADQISSLVDEAIDYQVVAPFAGYCAFYSSTVHVHGAFSKNKEFERKSKANLARNVKYLTKLKKYWGMFHFMTENLRDVYRRQADAARTGIDINDPAAAIAADTDQAGAKGEDNVSIFQYGDWFDRYPHGVSGTVYEEPSSKVKKEPGSDAVLGEKSDLQTVEEFFSKMTPPSGRNMSTSNAPGPTQQRKSAKKRQSSKTESKPAAPRQEKRSSGDSQSGGQQQQSQHQSRPSINTQNQDPQIAGAGLTQSPDSNAFHRTMSSSYPQQRLQQQQPPQQQHPSAFSQGFNPAMNPMLMNPAAHQQFPPNPHPAGMMSQLDRQMVLSSYGGGMDPSQAQQSLHNQMMGGGGADMSSSAVGNGSFPFDMGGFAASPTHAFGTSGNPANAVYFPDSSSAWFMPFNVDPPSVAEDGNLFGGGNVDWHAFGGFADAAGLGGGGAGGGGGGPGDMGGTESDLMGGDGGRHGRMEGMS